MATTESRQQRRARERAEAKAQKKAQKKANKNGMPSDLTGYLVSLIDYSQDYVNDVLKGLLNTTIKNPESFAHLIKHAKIKKTSEQPCASIQIGDHFHQFDPIHFGPAEGCDADTMIAIFNEFLDDKDAKLYPTMMFSKTDNKMGIGVGYMGKLGNVSVGYITNNGITRSFVSAIKSSTCMTHDLTGETDLSQVKSKVVSAIIEEVA